MDGPVDQEDEWEQLVRSGLLDDEPPSRAAAQEDIEIDAEDGSETIIARGMSEPKQPSREEVARHNLNHLPYRNWCPHCLASRRANNSHRAARRKTGRSIPFVCSDDCFIRKHSDEQLTVLVGKLYPSHAVFASGCEAKGPEDPVTDRLAEFLKSSGVSKLVYKSDQEPALKATIEHPLTRIGRKGE